MTVSNEERSTMVTRKAFLRRGAGALGGLVLAHPAGASAEDLREELAGSLVGVATKATTNSPHTVIDLLMDLRGNTVDNLHNHFDCGNSDQIVDFIWRPMSGGSAIDHGWLVFREVDAENFYQLDLFNDRMYFGRKVAHTFVNQPTLYRNVVEGVHDLRLTMVGNRFDLYGRENLASPILTYVDSENRFPVGVSFSYYTGPDTLTCWESVEAVII
jgi:hypothetical protein